jgi:hypothetical protein
LRRHGHRDLADGAVGELVDGGVEVISGDQAALSR